MTLSDIGAQSHIGDVIPSAFSKANGNMDWKNPDGPRFPEISQLVLTSLEGLARDARLSPARDPFLFTLLVGTRKDPYAINHLLEHAQIIVSDKQTPIEVTIIIPKLLRTCEEEIRRKQIEEAVVRVSTADFPNKNRANYSIKGDLAHPSNEYSAAAYTITAPQGSKVHKFFKALARQAQALGYNATIESEKDGAPATAVAASEEAVLPQSTPPVAAAFTDLTNNAKATGDINAALEGLIETARTKEQDSIFTFRTLPEAEDKDPLAIDHYFNSGADISTEQVGKDLRIKFEIYSQLAPESLTRFLALLKILVQETSKLDPDPTYIKSSYYNVRKVEKAKTRLKTITDIRANDPITTFEIAAPANSRVARLLVSLEGLALDRRREFFARQEEEAKRQEDIRTRYISVPGTVPML